MEYAFFHNYSFPFDLMFLVAITDVKCYFIQIVIDGFYFILIAFEVTLATIPIFRINILFQSNVNALTVTQA